MDLAQTTQAVNRYIMVFIKERRNTIACLLRWAAAFFLALMSPVKRGKAENDGQFGGEKMQLPKPKRQGTLTVERAIEQRRTVRAFGSQMLQLDQLSQLLWSAQGITGRRGFKRSAPSAGALYPMDVYVVIGQASVAQIDSGVYHYEPSGHELSPISRLDLRKGVDRASLSQMWMAQAPINFVITAQYSRITGKYGKRGVRYALIEAGHIGQNIYLQAEALGLKAGIVGAYHDEKLIEIMNLPHSHEPLLIMPAGYAA